MLRQKKQSGFTLIELIVGVAVFGIIVVAFYLSVNLIIDSVEVSRRKTVTTNLANQQMETLRNFPYADIATPDTVPAGNIPTSKTVTIDNINYSVNTYVSYVDDPYDGIFGGEPHDEFSADYKRVRIEVCWTGPLYCGNPSVLISDFSGNTIESGEGTGVMKVNVEDNSGGGVENSVITIHRDDPLVNSINYTNAAGEVIVPLLDPSNNNYHIIVTKENYGTDYTSPESLSLSPNNPDKSISAGELTEVTLYIDLLSALNINTIQFDTGEIIGDVDFEITGLRKTLGTDGEGLEVYKYQQDHNTSAEGLLELTNIEGDFYHFGLNDGDENQYSIAAFSLPGQLPDPVTTTEVTSDSTQSLTIYLDTYTEHNLLFTVRNDTNQLIEAADIRVFDGAEYDETRATTSFGQEFFRELENKIYNYTVTKDGYIQASGTIDVDGQMQPEITLTPL